MSDFSKRDWKVFQEKLPGWQEAYMDRLCKEYAELLNGDAKGSEKFWTIEKRIKEDLEEFTEDFKERIRLIVDRNIF